MYEPGEMMAYYPDLSKYSYLPGQTSMRNVGWLEAGHAFERGPVAQPVIDALLVAAEKQHHIMRGFHECEFCDEESPIRLPAPTQRGYVSLGMGELHFADLHGITYSAPSLIIHYIIQHQYQPPVEFIDAVLHGKPCREECI